MSAGRSDGPRPWCWETLHIDVDTGAQGASGDEIPVDFAKYTYCFPLFSVSSDLSYSTVPTRQATAPHRVLVSLCSSLGRLCLLGVDLRIVVCAQTVRGERSF